MASAAWRILCYNAVMDKRTFLTQSARTCALLRQMAYFLRQRARFSRGSTPQDKRRATHAQYCLRRRARDVLRVVGATGGAL